MKVLWITNNLLPDVCEVFNVPVVVKTGWLHSSANQIKSDVDLSIAALYSGSDIRQIELKGINYILVPSTKDARQLDESLFPIWQKVKDLVNPDVVHIHGTEYPTGLGYIQACGAKNVVVSIQGLISKCARYYNSGISELDMLKSTTFRDLIKGETLWSRAKRFALQGQYEFRYIEQASHFIGRTDWDKAYIMTSNPNAIYHFNNETLRDSFYTGKWTLERADKHTIFFSQATYPLKGLHMLLQAMPIILRYYPDTIVKVAGFDMTKVCTSVIKGKIKGTTYGFYLSSLIRKYKLEQHIEFIGQLTEEEMRDAYLSSHIFVSASAIENSSNSIGEAQILGVPVVASFVGGSDTMVENKISGLMYPFDDITRLASCIIDVFGDDDLAWQLSKQGRDVAMKRHDKNKNKEALIEIYNNISYVG